MTKSSMQTTLQISRMSNHIIHCLAYDNAPEHELLEMYDAADDKETFVLALIGSLITRHRQWQLACAAGKGRR